MIQQTKTVKNALKQIGINAKVRTTKNSHGEWGQAKANVRALTIQEEQKLQELLPYENIRTFFRNESYGFTVVN